MRLTTWRPEFPLSPIGTVGDFDPDPFAPFFSFVEYELQPDEAVSLAIAFRPALKARQDLLEAYIGLDELYKLAMKARKQLIKEIHCLPQIYREVVVMFYYDRRSYQEMAAMLGVTRAAINARLTKARAMLRRKLTGLMDP